MPDLLLELFSEEIPARMQREAAEDLKRLVTDALVARGLLYEGAAAFATPRRLALHVAGLPARQPDQREERRGPRVGAPRAAIDGFVKSAGLARIEDARVETDPKKGAFYVATIERAGADAEAVLAEILPPLLRAFPWRKSMRWGEASARPGALAWVRPLHRILCAFGPETEEARTIAFALDGIIAGDVTEGHRFMAPGPIRARRFDDYERKLGEARVVLDPERRKAIIRADTQNLAFAQNLELVEDDALLEEAAGLVEWPVVLMGAFEERFLEIPAEVIRATIRANQKCFVLRARGELASRFLLVANIEASDGGAAIVAGNERVVRARLSDALYFWRTDQKPLPDVGEYETAGGALGLDLAKPLDQRMARLAHLGVIFHEKLGTQGARVERVAALAQEIAIRIGAAAALARRAALLAKADLMTEVVGEFPETQGLIGRRYAELQGEPPEVSAAIEEHYRPLGPGDAAPTAPVSVAVALADKLDTLVGFWAIDEKPTGSKDPYALRRAALGVVRLVLENAIDARLGCMLAGHAGRFRAQGLEFDPNAVAASLVAFIVERLKNVLRDKGARHDLVDAALGGAPGSMARASRSEDDILLVARRVEALGAFLDTDDGGNLLAGFKRAANILKAEERREKDGGKAFEARPVADLRVRPEEHRLAAALDRAEADCRARVEAADFAGAMRALARLRAPVDAFFDEVTVNADDPALRLNRLRLLNQLRGATRLVADFSKIAG